MPVYLRKFYYNQLIKAKTEENKKIEASKNKSKNPSKLNIRRFK
jgi:hypothetical protein